MEGRTAVQIGGALPVLFETSCTSWGFLNSAHNPQVTFGMRLPNVPVSSASISNIPWIGSHLRTLALKTENLSKESVVLVKRENGFTETLSSQRQRDDNKNKICAFEGGGPRGQRGKSSQNSVFFLGNATTIKF